jgi:hypothetical protein
MANRGSPDAERWSGVLTDSRADLRAMCSKGDSPSILVSDLSGW